MPSSSWFGAIEGELPQQLLGLPEPVLRSILSAPTISDTDKRMPLPQAAYDAFMQEDYARRYGSKRDEELINLLALSKLLGQYDVPIAEGQSPSQRYGVPSFQQPAQLPPQLRALLGQF